jgi:mono/diheme cytochrome c family protein
MTGMRSIFLVLPLLAASLGAHAQAPSRGELLYGTHCVACHTSQIHWRDQRLARDWGTLKAQVRRFQDAAYLRWSDDDIEAVAHYLNDTIYRFPETQSRR